MVTCQVHVSQDFTVQWPFVSWDSQEEHALVENTGISSCFEPQEFNSLSLFAPALLCPFISFLFSLAVPVVLRWITVGGTEMAAAPSEEEESEEYRSAVLTLTHWSNIS